MGKRAQRVTTFDGPTANDLKELAKADRKHQAAIMLPRRHPGRQGIVDAAFQARQAVLDTIENRRQSVANDAAVKETMRLAALRGEDVERRGERLEIRSRDGLKHLYVLGRLSLDQYEAGKRYRQFYEAQVSGVRSCLADASRSGSESTASRRQRLVAWGWFLASIEHAVELHGAAALELLRKVAGEGVAIRTVAAGGKQMDKAVERLGDALDIAGEIIGRKSVAQDVRDAVDYMKDIDQLIKEAD